MRPTRSRAVHNKLRQLRAWRLKGHAGQELVCTYLLVSGPMTCPCQSAATQRP